MKKKNNDPTTHASTEQIRKLNRRNFLKKSSLGTLFGLTGAVEIQAADIARPAPYVARPTPVDTVNCGVIGFGMWGREIAGTLARIPEASLTTVCDSYEGMLRRAQRDVPQAAREADYRVVLDDPNIHAVFIATPTHQHREIALAAMQAGKHVYCEAPLAATVDDARAIAQAAQGLTDQVFHAGLLYRTEPQHRSVYGFIRSGATGKNTLVRSQWHTKQSWRRTSASREREVAQNWRLDADVSIGLIGEVGIQQLDKAFWMLQQRPVAATGFGQIRLWDDGRQVPDTIQVIFEYPDGTHMFYDATLASSFDATYDMFYGSDSTIMMRDSKAWMFKEVDAPMLGWEVYARKDKFYKETGIALLANATKLDAIGQDPTADDPNVESPLWYALNDMIENINFGPYPPAADYQRGYDATVVGIKTHEAIMNGGRMVFEDAWFDLG